MWIFALPWLAALCPRIWQHCLLVGAGKSNSLAFNVFLMYVRLPCECVLTCKFSFRPAQGNKIKLYVTSLLVTAYVLGIWSIGRWTNKLDNWEPRNSGAWCHQLVRCDAGLPITTHEHSIYSIVHIVPKYIYIYTYSCIHVFV